jgi:CRISPR type II-A-associated protein Csn2
MKLAHPDISAVLDTDIHPGKIPTLVIENRKFLREFLADISGQLAGDQGNTVLSRHNTPVEISRYLELLHCFTPFSCNEKALLTKITALLEKEAMGEEHYMETQRLLQRVETYVYTLAQDLPCEISCTKLGPGSLLKSAGLEIVWDGRFPLEQLVEYMELVRELDREKLFLLVNLRSYYSDEETALLLDTLIDHDLQAILLDSHAGKLLPQEDRWTIDEDLCEF